MHIDHSNKYYNFWSVDSQPPEQSDWFIYCDISQKPNINYTVILEICSVVVVLAFGACVECNETNTGSVYYLCIIIGAMYMYTGHDHVMCMISLHPCVAQ